MYDFDSPEESYTRYFDIGAQAALNDLNNWLFDAFQSFPSEDAAWEDMRKSEFGRALYERLTQFDDFNFNGSAEENE